MKFFLCVCVAKAKRYPFPLMMFHHQMVLQQKVTSWWRHKAIMSSFPAIDQKINWPTTSLSLAKFSSFTINIPFYNPFRWFKENFHYLRHFKFLFSKNLSLRTLWHAGIFTGSHFNNNKRVDDEEMMSWLHYDVIMTPLPLKSQFGGETSSEERDITLLWPNKKIKRFQHFIQELLQFEKKSSTLF